MNTLSKTGDLQLNQPKYKSYCKIITYFYKLNDFS